MIEQRVEPLFEQRQPMLHARKPSSGADSFIKRVAGGGPAKAFAVARAESLDRLLVQKRFGDRKQGETFDPAGGALIRRIERPDAFDQIGRASWRARVWQYV